MHSSCDVIIVGAGPGGLAAAHAIAAAAPHLQIAVYERSRASLHTSKRGAGLGLDVNGQKALQAINPDLLARVVEMASVLRIGKSMLRDGSVVKEVPFGQGARQEYTQQGYRTPCLLGWSDLQQLLVETLPHSVTIHTGMEFDRYECDEAAGLVTTYFRAAGASGAASAPIKQHTQPTAVQDTDPAAGSQPTPAPVAAASNSAAVAATGVLAEDPGQQQGQVVAVISRLVVASDGYFSRVRRQCLDDGPPEWGGSLVYRARLPAATAAEAGVHLTDHSIFVQDAGRFLFAYPISSGDVVWTVGISDENLQQLGMDSASIRQQLYGSSTGSSSSSSSSKAALSNLCGTVAAASAGNSEDASSSSCCAGLQTQGYSSQETAAGSAAKERCLQVLSGFSDPMVNLVQATPAASLVEHGVYTRPASKINPDCFGKGRVVIIGDAAHPLRPTGQGLNQTVEDAWALGKALQGGWLSNDTDSSSVGRAERRSSVLQGRLQAFREQRAARLKPVVAFTSESGKAAYAMGQDKHPNQVIAAAAGRDGSSMTAEEFTEFCCGVVFARLGAN